MSRCCLLWLCSYGGFSEPENFDMYEGIDLYEDVLIERNPDEPIPYQRQDELIEILW